MSKIKQVPNPSQNLEQVNDVAVQKAIKFFREHDYNLPEITQSPEGFALAKDFWLDPRVKDDKTIFSQSLATDQTEVLVSGTQWQLYSPSAEDLTKPAPPTNPPTQIDSPVHEDELNSLKDLFKRKLSEFFKKK